MIVKIYTEQLGKVWSSSSSIDRSLETVICFLFIWSLIPMCIWGCLTLIFTSSLCILSVKLSTPEPGRRMIATILLSGMRFDHYTSLSLRGHQWFRVWSPISTSVYSGHLNVLCYASAIDYYQTCVVMRLWCWLLYEHAACWQCAALLLVFFFFIKCSCRTSNRLVILTPIGYIICCRAAVTCVTFLFTDFLLLVFNRFWGWRSLEPVYLYCSVDIFNCCRDSIAFFGDRFSSVRRMFTDLIPCFHTDWDNFM